MSVANDGSVSFTSGMADAEQASGHSAKPGRNSGSQQVCVCGNVLKRDSVFCQKCGARREKSLEDAQILESTEVQATWNTTYYVPISNLEKARFKVVVHSDKKGIIGTVQHGVSSLQEQPELMQEFEDLLISTNGRQDDFCSSMMAPILHVMMRVWVLEAGDKLEGNVRSKSTGVKPVFNSARTSSARSNVEPAAVDNSDMNGMVLESPRKDKCECRVCILAL